MKTQRGSITFRDRARQIRDYAGLAYGKITPSDIDGVIDFGGRCFILIEYKLEGATLPYGQRLMYERICDALQSTISTSAVLIASHTHPTSEDIDCANASVIEYRWNGQWVQPRTATSVKNAVNIIRDLPNPTLPF